MKKTCVILIVCILVGNLVGCNKTPEMHYKEEKNNLSNLDQNGSTNETELLRTVGETEIIKIIDQIEMATNEQNFFEDRFVSEGHLIYMLKSCNVYKNIKECDLKISDFNEISNSYVDIDYLQEYTNVEDYVDKNGDVVASHKLVLLELEIYNKDAVGLIKKNQFNISGIKIVDEKTGDMFYISYFSESEDSPVEGQPYYYLLKQNSSAKVKIGFFVLTDGLNERTIKVQYGDMIYDWINDSDLE